MSELHDQTSPAARALPGAQKVSGDKCMFSVLSVIPTGKHPLAEAKKNALRAARADALVDVEVETDLIWAVVGHVTCVTVTGRAGRIVPVTSLADPGRVSSSSGAKDPGPSGPAPGSGARASVDCSKSCLGVVLALGDVISPDVRQGTIRTCVAACLDPDTKLHACFAQAGADKAKIEACAQHLSNSAN